MKEPSQDAAPRDATSPDTTPPDAAQRDPGPGSRAAEPPGPKAPAAAPEAEPEEDLPHSREFLEALIIAVIFAIFVRTFVVQAFKIPTGSMEENLLVGDHILVNKFIYGPTAHPWEELLLPVRDPRRGDVVVFKFPDDPSRDFIKRCVGLPGDEIELVDKALFINGERVEDESYAFRNDPRVYSRSTYLPGSSNRRDNFGPYLVPPGGYFCMGDNRDNSEDSRFWQQTTAPREYLKGRAVLIYWSFDPTVRRRAGDGPLERLGRVLGSFPERTRYERTFKVVR